ncbi:hypothetical protein Tcan_04412, partial [Toxocara canis]
LLVWHTVGTVAELFCRNEIVPRDLRVTDAAVMQCLRWNSEEGVCRKAVKSQCLQRLLLTFRNSRFVTKTVEITRGKLKEHYELMMSFFDQPFIRVHPPTLSPQTRSGVAQLLAADLRFSLIGP